MWTANQRSGGRLASMAAKKKAKKKIAENRSRARKAAPKKTTKKKSLQRSTTSKRPASRKKISNSAKKQVRAKKKTFNSTLFRSRKARTPSGDADSQGLSAVERADSESVSELLEEGNTFEAGIVQGVENADDADESEVRTREVPEDDVPEEYLDRN